MKEKSEENYFGCFRFILYIVDFFGKVRKVSWIL